MSPSTTARSLFVASVVVGLALLAAAAGGVALGAVGGAPVADASTAGAQPDASPELDLPERLELDGLANHDVATVGPDAGRAIERDAVAMDAAYRRYLLQERLDRAESDEERARALEEAIEASNETVRELRQREREALRQYANGELSGAQLVGVLSTVDARATEEIAVVEEISTQATRLGIPGVGPRSNAFTGQLMVRQGEVRQRASASITAERSSQRVYVATSGQGVVLSTVDGNTYHRESNRHDSHRPTVERGVETTEAWESLSDLYPKFSELSGFTSLNGKGTSRQLYRASGEFEHGSVWSYVDAYTVDVAREYQQIRLDDRLPRFNATNASAGSLQVGVERTYPSGPALVTVRDDGEPVSGAPVAVANETVATTDADGQAWVVLPYGTPRVETTVDGTRLATSVEWGA